MDTTKTTSVETTDTAAKNSEIIIDLKDSTYARGFKTENQLHADELQKAYKFIDDQLKKAKDYSPKKEDSITLTRDYDTIGVFGDRGSGKTSFILSLLKGCRGNKENKYEDVEVLRMIDPTLVEQKKPMVLCVLGMINGLVEHKLSKSECSDPNIALTRQGWEKTMKNLATGIIAIDQVGKEYNDSLWTDESYVINTGFKKVDKANEFERYIREMLTEALKILGKKAFMLAFDDIDVNVAKGWDVLESIRRYFSDPRIITIVSGNLKLYGVIVRENLTSDLKNSSYPYKQQMANELESQYMLKILKPERRINLVPLKTILNAKKGKENVIKFRMVKESKTEDKTVKDTYKDILFRYGISDTPSQSAFIGFLESMSLRSQINFVKELWDHTQGSPSLYVFSSRLYAAGIDLESLRQNENLTNIVILDYLTKNGNLPDSYLLLPTLPDKDTNSNFTALTFMECLNFKKLPYLMIDYLLRIGYLRNIILPMTDSGSIQNLIKYAGWNQVMSLKNNIGLTMAFTQARLKNSTKEHIPISGLERTGKDGKEKAKNKIDVLLEKHSKEISSLLALFPFAKISNSDDNRSQSFYSIFILLATIGEILKCESEEEMKSAINDLKLFRTYLKPAEGEVMTDDAEYGLEITTDPKNIDTLSNEMWKWKNNFNEAYLPPYALGRIATRLYNAVLSVNEKAVGESMNLMVSILLNACIIEESRVKVSSLDQASLNNSNPQTKTKVFIDNLKKNKIVNNLSFSKWMMACPMLNCFVEKAVYNQICQYTGLDPSSSRIKTFELINDIDVKDLSKGKTASTSNSSTSSSTSTSSSSSSSAKGKKNKTSATRTPAPSETIAITTETPTMTISETKTASMESPTEESLPTHDETDNVDSTNVSVKQNTESSPVGTEENGVGETQNDNRNSDS